MNKEVTCILTSCGRFDLLKTTLESFLKYNTYDIKEFFVIDDSNELLPNRHKEYPFITWCAAPFRRNQIASLDSLWSLVTTPYAFTMEDDWEFLQPGFIEASMAILEKEPKVLQVWLKEIEEHNIQPVEWVTKEYGIFKTAPFLWAWHRFNPSLKRKADYDLIAPFSKHTEWNPAKPWKNEADISKVYNNLGFTAAILPEIYIKHIGENRHVK